MSGEMYHDREREHRPANHSHPPIFSATDGKDTVCVYQEGNRRTLTLGSNVAQSALDLSLPARPVYRYTQGILISLLLRQAPERITLLGLGGGSLAHSFRALLPRCRIQAVERSALVFNVARDWFGLAQLDDLDVHLGEAAGFLKFAAPTDLLICDLYDPRGMDGAQESETFFDDLIARLAPGALAVFNIWSHNYRQEQQMLERVRNRFETPVLTLRIEGGNCLNFAFRDPPTLPRRKPFLESALLMGKPLNIPLHRLARTFWGQNSHILRQ